MVIGLNGVEQPGIGDDMNSIETVEFPIPDRVVGLVIGKGGECITRLQSESGCKIQIAPESLGRPERPCTITGPVEAIENAKKMITQVISRDQGGGGGGPQHGGGGGGGHMGGPPGLEMMIKGSMVGLVIGKSGEQIKQLQEKAGVKMIMIQDNNQPSYHDKPLRISGDPQKCQYARQLVLDLIKQKDSEAGRGNGFEHRGPPMGGGGGGNGSEVTVPRACVGQVIGRGGEMIQKIQSETGAKLQFNHDDGQSAERKVSVTGSHEAVQKAASMVVELIQQGEGEEDGQRGDKARFGRGGPNGYGAGGGGAGGDGDVIATTYQVPADKCGLVIGKGGETIRNINQVTKARVELQRNPPTNPNIRIFNIKGNGEQIQRAVDMICDKAGLDFDLDDQKVGTTQPPPGPHGLSQSSPGAGGFDQFQGGQPQFQQPQQDWNNQYQQWQQGAPSDAVSPPGEVKGHATPAAPAGNSQDFSAQWVEYYRKYGMHEYADAILAQTGAGGTPAGGAPVTGAPAAAPAQQFGQPYQQPYTQQPGFNQPAAAYGGQQNYGQYQQQNSW